MFDSAERLARVIDHTLVRPDATIDDLTAACRAAQQYRFAALILNSWQIGRARDLLASSGVAIGAVVGFPHGSCTTAVKIFEAMEAMKNGATELDIMINLGMLKSGRLDLVEIDVKNVIAMTKGMTHKVIIECSALSAAELADVCRIAARAGAAFIKTSTGYGSRGATIEDIQTIRTAVGTLCRIKASGGVRDLATLEALVDAGADRIGTSSGPAIMEEYRSKR
ncbi:MAG: deoxyribose-phosphate aldolase [Nitrospiraceae bacterium]|nr:deoxyribose-phosphate aldolase [Nitrospiraceae bacterium]